MSSGIVKFALLTAVIGIGAVALTSQDEDSPVTEALDDVREKGEDVIDAINDGLGR